MKKVIFLLVLCYAAFLMLGCNALEEKVNPIMIAKAKRTLENKVSNAKSRFSDRINNRFYNPSSINVPSNSLLEFTMTATNRGKTPCKMRQFDYEGNTYLVMYFDNGIYYAIQKNEEEKAIIFHQDNQRSFEQVMYDEAYLVGRYNAEYEKQKDSTNNQNIHFIEGGIAPNKLPRRFVSYEYDNRRKKLIRKEKGEIVMNWFEES